jgi:hypothetical protein
MAAMTAMTAMKFQYPSEHHRIDSHPLGDVKNDNIHATIANPCACKLSVIAAICEGYKSISRAAYTHGVCSDSPSFSCADAAGATTVGRAAPRFM